MRKPDGKTWVDNKDRPGWRTERDTYVLPRTSASQRWGSCVAGSLPLIVEFLVRKLKPSSENSHE